MDRANRRNHNLHNGCFQNQLSSKPQDALTREQAPLGTAAELMVRFRYSNLFRQGLLVWHALALCFPLKSLRDPWRAVQRSSMLRLAMRDEGLAQWNARFNNIPKLYPQVDTSLVVDRLRHARALIVGLGGVGSWAAEALARSGIENFHLVDLDDVCISNTNRQSHALTSTIGRFKAEVLRDRILDINPCAQVNMSLAFITQDNINDLFVSNYTYVVEAVDGVADKASIIDACVRRRIPVISSGGAAGLVDPTLLAVSDMVAAEGDNLIMRVRKHLRQRLKYPRGDEFKAVHDKAARVPWNISVVHTLPTGISRSPQSLVSSSSSCDASASSWRKCDGLLGNACFVTGTMGFLMASTIVNAIATESSSIPDIDIIRKLRGDSSEEETVKDPLQDTDTSGRLQSNNNTSMLSSGEASSVCLLGPTITGNVESHPNSSLLIALQEEISDMLPSSDGMLIDSHSHLQLDPLYDDVHNAVLRAQQATVKRIVVCGVCPGRDWDRLQSLRDQYPALVMPQYGLHPWHIANYRSSLGAAVESVELLTALNLDLRRVLEANASIGVGECGLDKNIKRTTSMEIQTNVLMLHANLASEYRRPLTLHCVGAWGKLLDCLRSAADKPPSIVLHSCNGMTVDMLPRYLDLGNVYFSFNARQLGQRERVLLRSIPLHRLLIESDSPDQLPSFLAELGLTSNEPSLLPFTCRAIAEALSLSIAEVASATARNAVDAFAI